MRPTLPLALLVPAVLAGCASQQTVDAQAESVSRQLDAQASTVSQQLAALKQAQTSMAEAQKNLQARLDKLESQQSLIATRLNQESTASAALQHDVDSLRNQTSTTQGEVAALSGQVSSQTSAIAQATSAAGDALRIAGDSQVAINSAADRLRITEETVASQTLAVAQAQDTANNALKIARESEAASSSAADKLRTTEEIVSSQNRAIAQAEDTANDAVKIARDSRLVSGKVVESLLLTENMVSYSYEQPELTSQGRAALDTLIAYVKPKLPHVFVEIIGYTDSLSLDSQNRRIALERAESVRRYLHETGGIPLDRMSTISYGDLKPVASNTSFEGRVQNRRVLVQVLK